MKHTNKKYQILFLIFFCLCLTGCSNKNSSNKSMPANSPPSVSYTSSISNITGVQSVGYPIFYEDTLYFIHCNYDEFSGQKSLTERQDFTTEVYSYSLQNKIPVLLPITFEKGVSVECMSYHKSGIFTFLTLSLSETGKKTFEFRKINLDGTMINTIDITSLIQDFDTDCIQNIIEDKDGFFYLWDGNSKIIVVDKDGSLEYSLLQNSFISDVFLAKDNNVYVLFNNKNQKYFSKIDKQKKDYEKKIPLTNHAITKLYNGTSSDYLFQTSDGLYRYVKESNEVIPIINWLDYGILNQMVVYVGETNDNQFFILCQTDKNVEIVFLTIDQEKTKQERKRVTISGMDFHLDTSVEQAIIDFNRLNNNYKIEVLKNNNTTASQTIDLTLGTSPDLLNIEEDSLHYAYKNVWEDLYPYMEKDPSIKKDLFLEHVLNAYETNQCLYVMPVSFVIQTCVGKSKFVGEKAGISIPEFMSLADSIPEGSNLYSNLEKELMFAILTRHNINQFIDFEHNTVNFKDGKFQNLLEFANRLKMYEMNNFNEAENFQSDKLIIINTPIDNMQTYQVLKEKSGNEKITFVGIPGIEGNGSYFRASPLLAISKTAKEKEGAWEFIKFFLSKEYQKSLGNTAFPIRKDILEENFNQDMTEEWETDEKGIKIEKPKLIYQEYNTDWSTNIYAATKEEVDEVKNLIVSTHTISVTNYDLEAIIREEASYYFSGVKSADEVIELIENRVQLYLDEKQ